MATPRGAHATPHSPRTLDGVVGSRRGSATAPSSALPAHALSGARLHAPLDLAISRSFASTCGPSLLQREARLSRATRRSTLRRMAGQDTLLLVLDLAGIFVFAITGGLVAVRRQFDIFGVMVLAGATGLGGGFLRDVLIDATPPAALTDWRYLLVPIAAGLATFLFHPAFGRLERVIIVLDAAGLGLFCVTGTLKAIDYGLGPVPAALMGMVTGIGGGMVRDLLAGRVPVVFSSELYATPALLGATWAVLANYWELPVGWVALPGVAICFGMRLLALRRDWHAPLPRGSASV